jgi:hypothetical protein
MARVATRVLRLGTAKDIERVLVRALDGGAGEVVS